MTNSDDNLKLSNLLNKVQFAVGSNMHALLFLWDGSDEASMITLINENKKD